MKIKEKTLIYFLLTLFLSNCATTKPKPLAYLSSEKPKGIIRTQEVHKDVNKSFFKGGWYFANHNFRPAVDIQEYIKQAEKEVNSTVLRNADVELNIPFAFDILFFGYNKGTDTVTAKK